MANPKYADLPGIARDQPDVYETNDLPESDQSHLISDVVLDQSDSVEQIKLSPTEAYDRFKDKNLDARNVDFTDSIAYKRKTGYDVRSGEWEILGNESKEKETPFQTYNRLQYEAKVLMEEVQKMKETSDDSSSQVPPVVLAEQIEQIHKGLQNLHMEEILGSEAVKGMSDPLGTIYKNLLVQIENFKKMPVKEKKSKTSSSSVTPISDAFTYELYVRPEQSKLEEMSKVAELEQRLKNLENMIGSDKNKLNVLTSNTDDKTIMSSISLLTSKLNLLDSGYLDQIESRLLVLHQCMQQVTEKKQQIEDAEKQNKVAELYELAKKVDGMSSSLPQVVERLVALKELHEQALQFSKALTQLDTTQQQLTSSIKNNETLLKKMEEAFIKNNEMIEKNISSLNIRMDELKK